MYWSKMNANYLYLTVELEAISKPCVNVNILLGTALLNFLEP